MTASEHEDTGHAHDDGSDADGHDHEAAAPITDEVHDNSWSANLEKPHYAGDPERAVRDGLVAVEHTVAGNHVNLVTHADLGHPVEFIYDALASADAVDRVEYVEQCGCGGHVTRVHVE